MMLEFQNGGRKKEEKYEHDGTMKQENYRANKEVGMDRVIC